MSKDECQELKNIQYKNMLLGGSINDTIIQDNIKNLDNFLEKEKTDNENGLWTKLNKTTKHKKLVDFTENYKNENSLTNEEEKLLQDFFKECLDKKKLNRVKDVVYDKNTGVIKDIPALTYNKETRHFSLKNMDKNRISTLKSLPTKKSQTIKNRY
jgi:hypothetical protein